MNVRTFTMLLMALSVMNALRFIIALLQADVRTFVFTGTLMIILAMEFKYLKGINTEFKSIIADLKDKYIK